MFNDRLRLTRMYRKITQQHAADLLDIALRNYQKYEEGYARPSYEALVVLAETLNVPVDFLLERDSYLSSLGVSVDVPLTNPPKHPKSRQRQQVNPLQGFDNT